jgi:hypothetical protein
LYQVVFLSEYGQSIIGITDTFKVLRRTNATRVFVKTDKQFYNAGEDIIFTVQRQLGTRGWMNMYLFYYPVNATVYNSMNQVVPTEWDTLQKQNPKLLSSSLEWHGNTTTYEFPISIRMETQPFGDGGFGVFNQLQRYKVAIYLVYDDFFLLGVTKPIRVSNGISVQLPKRWLRNGETIPIKINNPYYNFTFGEYSFETRIVKADPAQRFNQSFVVTEPTLKIDLDPGMYKFAFYSRQGPDKDRYEFDITNSSFRVI